MIEITEVKETMSQPFLANDKTPHSWEKIMKLEIEKGPYQILITGDSCSGKHLIYDLTISYLSDIKKMNIIEVPGYESRIEGLLIRKLHEESKISEITFQNYILDYYEQVIEKLKIKWSWPHYRQINRLI